MIVRTWHGAVPLEKAAAFRDYLEQTGVTETKATPGNLGAYVYHETQDQYEHFFLVTYWESYAAVRRFAGQSPHIAVTYPEDSVYSLISDPIVLHHEVQTLPDRFPLIPPYQA